MSLHDGKNIHLSGICLDKITHTFPTYPLNEVERDIHKAFLKSGGDPSDLPKLSPHVGGDTDLMIGIQYLKYYPVKMFELPNGLGIYKSQFMGSDGSRGIVAGPHRIFSEIHKCLGNNHVNMSAYIKEVTQIYKFGYQVSLDTSLLGIKEFLPERNEIMFDDKGTFPHQSESDSEENVINDTTTYNEVYLVKRTPKYYKKFEEIESVGTEVSYRCAKCRGCSDCLKSKNINCISIQEEVEQAIIDKSVKVNLDQNLTSVLLPFLSDPVTKLASNKKMALTIYRNQVTNLNKRKKDK